MSAPRQRRGGVRYLLALWLVAVWVALWGRLSVANVASGLLVAGGLLALVPPGGPPPRYVFRPIAVLRLVGYFLLELLVANLALIREVVTPRDRIRTGIIAVPMVGVSDGLLTLVANMTALTPGTLTVEVRGDPATFYVHVLHLHDVEGLREEIRRLEHLAIHAFGSEEALAALHRSEADRLGPTGRP